MGISASENKKRIYYLLININRHVRLHASLSNNDRLNKHEAPETLTEAEIGHQLESQNHLLSQLRLALFDTTTRSAIFFVRGIECSRPLT